MIFEVRNASDHNIMHVKVNNLLDLIDLQMRSIRYFDGSNSENYFRDCALIVNFKNGTIEIYDDYIE